MTFVADSFPPAPAAHHAHRDPPAPPPPAPGRLDLARSWSEAFGPPTHVVPDDAAWTAFVARLQTALDRGSLADLAALAPLAHRTLASLRHIPVLAEETTWLAQRLDYMDVAAALPATDPAATTAGPVPFLTLWQHRLRDRPAPPDAATYTPPLAAHFTAAGLPAAFVWLAEVESSFNPRARSPVGAVGLYQLMPDAAVDSGLALTPRDQRLDPARNAAAAARYLATLHARFADWPLALAAYNAGPARVAHRRRLHSAPTYAALAPHLPAKTRMFVPRVLATLALRTGWSPSLAA